MHDRYRQCASLVLLRPSSACGPDGCTPLVEVLLLHKPRKRDSWQLPQGGVEKGETVEQAALRELKEEAGIDAEVLGATERCYQYDFPASYRRFRPDEVCGQCIHFVFAIPKSSAPVQVDGKEIDSFLWVLPEDLGRYLKRQEYLNLARRLVEEASVLVAARKV